MLRAILLLALLLLALPPGARAQPTPPILDAAQVPGLDAGGQQNYLRFTRRFNEAFPGFDTDVHGLVEQDVDGGPRRYYVDCVRA